MNRIEFWLEHYSDGEHVACIVPVKDYHSYRLTLWNNAGADLQSEELVTGLNNARHKARRYAGISLLEKTAADRQAKAVA